jgi:predicted ATPase
VLPESPDPFPSLRTTCDPPTNLPAPETALIGRDAELSAVVAALRQGQARLVTLTGPGGSGKTRLVLQAARHLLAEFPGGAFFVDLVPVSDARRVLAAAAEALGLYEAAGRTLEDALFDWLRGRPALLVLDNLEHLEGAGAPIASLLAACPSLKILATSRAPLRLRAERELHVPPLAGVAAVDLFLERARAVAPELEITGRARDAVAGICARLDGLPLAIELAAARIRVLPPEALLKRVDRRLALLTRGAADLPDRQRTLEATIAWSYDLLGADEQRLFAVLGAVPGRWTLEAVDAAWGHGETTDVLDGLESLVEKNLVLPPAPDDVVPRYGMLETLREFALARLEQSGAADRVRRRLAEYHAALADAAFVETVADGLDRWSARLDAELDGIRATMAHSAGEPRLLIAGGLQDYMEARGALSEGRRWVREALADTPAVPSRARALALIAACFLGRSQSEADEPAAAELQQMIDQIDDALVRVCALDSLGWVAFVRGDRLRSEAFMRRGLEASRGDSGVTAQLAMNNLADILMADRRYGEARPLLEDALALSAAIGRSGVQPSITLNLAGVALAEGRVDDARRWYENAVTLVPEDNVSTTIYVVEGLAWCQAAQGRAEVAARLLGAAETHAEAAGFVFDGFEADMHTQAVARVRAALGEDRVRSLWEEGRELSLKDACGYALGTPTAPALAAAL